MNHETPRIAVVFATAQGSTKAIAECIGADLAHRGAQVEVADAEHAPELSRFDAVILGSAVHNVDVLPEMTAFTRAHRRELTDRDVWLFTVGLGPALRGPIGRRIGRVVPPKIAALRDAVQAVDYKAFAGRFEHVDVSWRAGVVFRLLCGGRYGDLRDWPSITEWTATIAHVLRLPQPTTTITSP
ncbi:flavodoxin domain-containing protein [Nocardia spumae]|uniref:flavodoxin domain-containing protein n=1 Tax=Nocardia spumae TaxID=2887190 RepID=UPI001D158630|nr:flavodoxin domain-containing protein [Nocardia spumae]